ncbi:hypothetical protein [Pseudomonas atagonensis]|uniref:hypothetical protein n=1 Tax=Pseudomonas atagonensis TaxID=2609964 RepID=UPI00140AA47E|nr:hypothetical protein [Pseudomonas atagonensis]
MTANHAAAGLTIEWPLSGSTPVVACLMPLRRCFGRDYAYKQELRYVQKNKRLQQLF